MSSSFFTSLPEMSAAETTALDESTKAFHELERSPDRVTAIVGGAILDDQMQKAIRNRFINDQAKFDKFLDESLDGTQDKIRLLYLLGVIRDDTRDHLARLIHGDFYFERRM